MTLTAEITKKLTAQIPNYEADEKRRAVRKTKQTLDEGRDLIGQMEVEVGGLPSNQRGKLQARVRDYESQLNKLDRELRQTEQRIQREELLEGADYDLDLTSSDDARSKLLDNTARLENASDRLDATYRVALETEELGVGIINNLAQQRETITHARDGLKRTDSNLKKSGIILRGMMRRVIQNKILLGFIGLVLLGAIILIIYLKVKPSGGDDPPSPAPPTPSGTP